MTSRNYDAEYKKWRAAVLKRDSYKCKCCSYRVRRHLQAHHIQRWVDSPDLRYVVANGITLCKRCHFKMRNNEPAWESTCRAALNKDAYIRTQLLLRGIDV